MKIFFNKFISKWMVVILLGSIVGIASCSSSKDTAKKYLEKGTSLFEKGDYVKADIQFRNALQIDRTLSDAIWGRMLVAEKQSNFKALFKLLNQILANDPNHLEAQVKLARIFLIAGKMDKALELSDKSLLLNDSDLSVLSLRAAILLKLGNTKESISYANKVLSKDSEHVDALTVLALERLTADDSLKAISYIERGLVKDKKHIGLQLIKLQALDNLSQTDKAVEVYRKLIAYYPNSYKFNYALAKFYIKHNQFDDAENVYRVVVREHPEDNKAKLQLVHYINAKKGLNEGLKQLTLFVEQAPNNSELKFSLVNFYLVQKNHNRAVVLLKEIISSSEKNEDILRAKGIIAGTILVRGDNKGAEIIVKEILSVDKHHKQGLLLKAKIDIDRRLYDNAIGSLRTILRDTPNSSRAALLLAQAHLLSGSPELADEQYLRAFKSSKLSPAYGLAYADFLLKRKQPVRAEGILKDVLSTTPRNIPTLKILAKIKLGSSDWVAAQEIADKIKFIEKNETTSNLITSAILTGKKDFSNSITLLKSMYNSSKESLSPVIGLVRTYLLAGKTKEAESFLGSVLKASPENMNVRVILAKIYASQGKVGAAKKMYEDIIGLGKNNHAGYYQLAVIQLKEKNINAALLTLNKGLEVAPKSFALRITKANVLTMRGEVNKSIAIYEGLIDEKNDSDIVVNNLATLLTEHRKDKASFNKAYALSQRFKRSNIPQFKDTIGWASYRVGKFADAKILLESVIKSLPNVPDFHYHLGMIHLAQKNKKLARKELELALKLAGDTPFAQADEIRVALEKI